MLKRRGTYHFPVGIHAGSHSGVLPLPFLMVLFVRRSVFVTVIGQLTGVTSVFSDEILNSMDRSEACFRSHFHSSYISMKSQVLQLLFIVCVRRASSGPRHNWARSFKIIRLKKQT